MKSEDYNALIAYHYQSYRPPLHPIILETYLSEEKFEYGLDIGCGTGRSTVALKEFCTKTLGIDPSKAMLEKTTAEESITYEYFDGLHININRNSFDIITLAGSWWYGKSQQLIDEIFRVGKSGTPVLLYDFEVLFAPIYQKLQLEIPSQLDTYDHFIDFSNYNTNGFQLFSKVSEEITLKVSTQELTHLICSENQVFKQLQLKYTIDNPFKKLFNLLQEIYSGENIELWQEPLY